MFGMWQARTNLKPGAQKEIKDFTGPKTGTLNLMTMEPLGTPDKVLLSPASNRRNKQC